MAKRGIDLLVITGDITIILLIMYDRDMVEIIGLRITDTIIILVHIGNEDKEKKKTSC